MAKKPNPPLLESPLDSRSTAAPYIKEIRERLGWSQADLAKLAKTSQQTIDRIERGETLHSRAFPAIMEVLRSHAVPTPAWTEPKIIEPPEHPATSSYRPLRESFLPTSELSMPAYELADGGLLKFTRFDPPQRDRKTKFSYEISVMTADFAPEVGRLDVIYVDLTATPRVGDLVVAYKRWDPYIEQVDGVEGVPGQRIALFRISEWAVYQKVAASIGDKKSDQINLVGWEVHKVAALMKVLAE
ncbi:transcriptional regulator with XRE-family HTH domain [Bradyrhizobium elkanii]|uniref:helix-turn-helix transcriptional regulator n=1 Tax=Bradyrhizobium elkanii TaxID=29448 RepID=UPI00216A8058|nr:helix-turn-helix transcriptional regulator [Bradyrhizobium elkanii]MCS3451946.1 transcriptional regulator with XRE-family HTH domain [Bradyrhizobium elkanii]MCS3565955.1 transcriptional regulator with XRE-family HTH domain [Bradyrhizobium elkanii]MCW2153315.1 transcriptional regulator with XRE-family HTH domain [Bradyrhizobium elkanii]MCW2377048.1 transcriptional regulator with XRE-family HTH domain [Bradyrhizobium elkanii]